MNKEGILCVHVSNFFEGNFSKRKVLELKKDILDNLKNNDSSNPVFYINYAHARINQLFKKANLKPQDVEDANIDNINQDGLDLAFQSLLLGSILQDAFDKRDMQKITDYLHNLASMVHKFYNEHKIVGIENEKSYLKILNMSALSIRTALMVLGIKAKEIM